ncbi:MAG: chemotaxis protein CheX [Halobacteriovoraceae bacterium]|nr:chemotaxis protein CheX [Halobacteriovoraceae bacterium]
MTIAQHLKLEERLVPHLVNAVMTTFKAMTEHAVEVGDVTWTRYPISKSFLSGHIGLIQDEAEGVLTCGFKEETVFYVIEKMFGLSFDEINKTVLSAVGEFTNLIYAPLKKVLNEQLGYDFKMAMPMVVVGADHAVFDIYQDGSLGYLTIPFSLDGRELFVQLMVRTNK